jgi:imidazolonepropionase-like amidohydrolase
MKKSTIILGILFLFHLQGISQSMMIRCDRVFDGVEMHYDWVVVTESEYIVFAGREKDYIQPVDTILSFENSTLMPGMIEGHSHVLLYPYDQTSWNDQVLKESRSLRAIRGAQMATKNLMAGFTTIRDLGSEGAGYADVAIKESIKKGLIKGPRMLVAGPAIVATGSYGPKGFHPDMDVHLGAEAADGPDLIRVTRDQIGKGADVIKVYADYRWGPNGESKPTFSIDELKMIVETAASSGRQTVAHANSDEAIRRAVMAGVSTIEHGSEATMETLQLMAEKGVGLCPTLAATHAITRYRGWDMKSTPEPPAIIEKRALIQNALKAGVTIIAGGDVGVFPHGENVKELELMVDYGMNPADVLKSVTSINAQAFELNKLGQLKKGYVADLIVVNGNPEKDISDLYDIKLVVKDGVVMVE